MATVCKLPHLPKTGTDGEEICDKYGNRWKFTAQEEGWISRGTLTAPTTVSESKDGIITPTIFNQLKKARAYLGTGANLAPLKISPGTDAYWYYFRSSDKFIRFRPEAEDALRIEVDRGRLFQVLMKEICPGKRGIQGEQGETGQSGLAGPAEVCYQPTYTNSQKLDFAIFTPVPLTGSRTDITLPNNHIPDISVRLYGVTLTTQAQVVTGKLTPRKLQQRPKNVAAIYDQLQHLAIYYHSNDDVLPKFQKTRDLLVSQSLGTSTEVLDISLSPVLVLPLGSIIDNEPSVTILIDPLGEVGPRITFDESLPVDEEATLATVTYDSNTNIVSGSVILTSGQVWSGEWCVKSRQRGPDGDTGDVGESTIRIIETTLDDTNIIATCPIINARVDNDVIFTLCSDILSSICVDQLRVNPSASNVSDKTGTDAVFAAAQMILDDCKLIYRYQIRLVDDEFDDLVLAYWDPQPGCITKRHFKDQKFDWVAQTTNTKCDALSTWFDTSMKPRSGKYPNAVLVAQTPPKDECCQDDFFWCPNIQDGGCPSTASSAPPPPTGTPPPPVSCPFAVDFTWTPTSPSVGQRVQFASVVTCGTSPYTYSWTFGDGTSSTFRNPSHTYSAAKTYTVKLTVTDSEGKSKTATHQVVVGSSSSAVAPEAVPDKSRKWRT